VTLVLTVLIVLSAVLTMSLVFVVLGGLATLLAYHLTNNLETALAVGLLAGLAGWFGVSLVPDFWWGSGTTTSSAGSGSRSDGWALASPIGVLGS
jgi:hypothetical protein